ncbi:MAG: hypothetical protein WCH74_15040 [Chloroflexota bacterium]
MRNRRRGIGLLRGRQRVLLAGATATRGGARASTVRELGEAAPGELEDAGVDRLVGSLGLRRREQVLAAIQAAEQRLLSLSQDATMRILLDDCGRRPAMS